jgi:uncharacterized membrane protein YcaP (DUF421 family)
METVIRVALIYVFIMAGLRVMGKREFGQLSPIELVTLLLIPEIVSQAMIMEDFPLPTRLSAQPPCSCWFSSIRYSST